MYTSILSSFCYQGTGGNSIVKMACLYEVGTLLSKILGIIVLNLSLLANDRQGQARISFSMFIWKFTLNLFGILVGFMIIQLA